MKPKRKSCLSRLLIGLGVFLGLCLLLSIVSALSNRNLPVQDDSEVPSALDKARLAEALQLKTTLGEQVWQGWGNTPIPVILWNHSHEFLFEYASAPTQDWTLAQDDFFGRSYYTQTAHEPQNFAVKVGDVWTASIATKTSTDVFLIETFQSMFPAPLKQIFPYRFLIQPSETQIGAVLHETFHVYQYQMASARITNAESIHKLGEQYEETATAFNTEFKQESALLADALQADTKSEKIKLVRQFLAMRAARRQAAQLSEELIDYERWLEWEEGTAKYIEVAILKAASASPEYRYLPEMQNDPDFKKYQTVDQRWSQELFQLRYQTTSGETQFYMTGLAEAFLLDDLLPNWQDKYWDENVFLEDLLRMSVAE